MNSNNLKIFSAYLGLSFLWLLPATVRPFSALPSGPYSDAGQALWAIQNFSWTGERFSKLSYPPRGVSYEYIDWTGVPNTLVQPLSFLFGPFFAYNLLLWLCLGLTAFSAYHLARLFGAEKWGALLAGFCFGFCPALAGQVILGHFYYILGATLIAPYLYSLLSCLRADKPLKWGGATLVVWVLLLRTCHYYALFLVPISMLLTIWDLWLDRKSSLKTAVSLLVAGVFISVLTILPLIGTGSETEFTLKRVHVEFYDADLLGLVTPSPYHPIWGSEFHRSGDRVVFCGFTLLLLAFWAFRKSPKILMSLWLFASVMSLGPTLLVGGEKICDLPWAKLFELPGYVDIQVYARAGLLAQLFLAIWVGCAVKSKKMAAVAAGLLAFEFLLFPVPTMTTESTAILSDLRERKMGTVLYLPYEGANTEPLYYQMVHQRGMLRSPVLRPSEELIRFFDALPWVAALTGKNGYEAPPPETGPTRTIRLTDLRYLMLDKRRLSDQQMTGWRVFLPSHFLVEEVLENEAFLIYVLADLEPALLNTVLKFDYSDLEICFWGWSKPTSFLGRRVRQMKGSESSIWFPVGAEQDYQLRLTSTATESSSASVLWNGELLGPLIGGTQWARTDFTIPAKLIKEGANQLELVTAPGSEARWYFDELTLEGL